MKSIVPYTKDIEFNTKIAEICSISLEHELNIGETEIEGNFLVSGEYKSHEVSVNKESFDYKLPFALEVTDDVIKDTIDFEITDFTYEVVGDSTLRVNIEFCVTADEKEEIEEVDVEKEEIRESVMEEIQNMFSEDEEEIVEEVEEDRLDENSENIILSSMEEKESEFATYHIHIVNNNDSIESICAMYGTDVNTLKEYNNVESVSIGDKLIIPCLDE